MSRTYRSAPPCRHTHPRPHQDASQRFHTYGPIQPMERPRGFLARLLGRGR